MRTYTIIGSGITSRTFLNKLIDLNNNQFEIYWIIDNRNETKRFHNSNQINRKLGKNGTSNAWHAVSPVDFDSDYLKFFQKFYRIKKLPKKILNNKGDFLYVPRSKPNIEKLPSKRKVQKNVKIIYGTVQQIIPINKGELYEIYISNNKKVHSNKVFVGTNILDLSSLLHSPSCNKDYIIYDHIQIYAGVIERKNILNKYLIEPILTKTGYYVGCENSSNSLLMLKSKHDSTQHASILNFGQSTSKIIWDIISSFNYKRIIEAFSVKFGIFYKTEEYNVYIQKKVIFSDPLIQKKLSRREIDEELKCFKSIRPILKHYSGHIIHGNHQIGEKLNNQNRNRHKNIWIGNIRKQGWLDGRHHTLLNSFENIKKCVELMD